MCGFGATPARATSGMVPSPEPGGASRLVRHQASGRTRRQPMDPVTEQRRPGGTDAPALSAEQLGELLPLLAGADSVELKLTVSDEHYRSTAVSLGMDILDAQIRQVCFF